MSDEPLEHSCMNPTACLTCLSKGRLIPGPMEVIEKGAFKEQSDVPVFKHNNAGEVLGQAHVNPDGTVDIELNDAGAALFADGDDLSMYSIHTPIEKDTSMREYAVVWSTRNGEYTVVFQDEEDLVWTEHSGPYFDPAIAEEVADALTIKARSDAGTL